LAGHNSSADVARFTFGQLVAKPFLDAAESK
jgi:hypothetical protein